MSSPETDEQIGYGTPRGRWVITAAVLGTALAFLDATVVNVALPQIGQDLDATLGDLQWTVTGYMLTLSALILTGGALGDRYGRRRIFIIGTIWFAAASLLCGIAPNVPTLVAARAFQGIGGALLTPASLAIIEASFRKEDRGRAIGAWSGLGGVAAAVGPFVGGYLLSVATWRVIFLINIPMAAAIVWVTVRHVPESSDPSAPRQPDVAGAALGALGLGAVVYGLIRASEAGFGQPIVWVALAIGIGALVSFGFAEVRGKHPMLPLDIFSSRQFTGANLVTFVVYAALSGMFFMLVITLQQVVGYTPLQAGIASLPVTVLMLLLSSRAGALAQRIGPRIPMTLGPFVIALGMYLMTGISIDSGYASDILPAQIVFGLGLSLTVAPLTATVLQAADERHAGIASGVNNAVARVAGLMAVAVLPMVAGLSGDDYLDPAIFARGFHTASIVMAALAAVGGVIAWFTISNDTKVPPTEVPTETHCSVSGPPLRTSSAA